MAEIEGNARLPSESHVPDQASGISALSRLDKRVFVVALAIATVFPIVFNLAFDQGTNRPIDNVFSLLLILSTMHVALTGFFFFDTEYRTFMRERWRYFYAFPLALIVICGVITNHFGEAGEFHVLAVYHAWLLWHYGRQNLGILSFVANISNSVRVSKVERLILNAAALGGILGAYGVLRGFDETVAGVWQDQIVWVGTVIFSVAAAASCVNAVFLLRRKVPLTRALFSFLLPLFFAPTFFFNSYFEAVIGYAIAHACQYFLFMYYLAAGNREKTRLNVLVLAGIAVVGWIGIWLTRDASLWGMFSGFMPGVALAIVMWHFVIDAGVWRLSDPWQRSQIQQRFDFVFSK